MSTAFDRYQRGNDVIGSTEIRNRFGHHKGNEETGPKHEQARLAFITLAETLDQILPSGTAKVKAFDVLQDASMWAHFTIAEVAPVVFPPKPKEQPIIPYSTDTSAGDSIIE